MDDIIKKLELYIEDYEDLLKEKRVSIKKVRELIEKYKNGELEEDEKKKLENYYKRIKKIVEEEDKKRKQTNLLRFIK